MSKANVIRAWKDTEYRNSLTAAELNNLPANPAGYVLIDLNLSDDEPITTSRASVCCVVGGF